MEVEIKKFMEGEEVDATLVIRLRLIARLSEAEVDKKTRKQFSRMG